MAFKFKWTEFNREFLEEAKKLLTIALNKGSKPANIVGQIKVKELHLGTTPPELEILEIGELAEDKFRGIFKLVYSGDAYVVLQTQVQANPVNSVQSESIFGCIGSRWGVLAAGQPLVVPMLLSLRNLKLRGIIVLVVDKQKGVTLVFKNDPLENVEVSSTFDEVPAIRMFLQREIETQMRKMMQEEMPTIVHELSRKYLNKQSNSNTESASFEESSKVASQSDTPSYVRKPYHRSYSAYSGQYDDHNVPSLSVDIYPTRWRGNDDFSDEGYESGCFTPTPEACYNLSGLHQEQGLKKLFESGDMFSTKSYPRVYHSHSLCGTPSGRPRLSSVTSTLSLPALLEPERYPDERFTRGATRKRRVKYSAPPLDVLRETAEIHTTTTQFDSRPPVDYFDREHHDICQAPTEETETVLQPSDNALAAQLASLMNSHHTISPYTRIFEHLTYRSSPHFAKVVNVSTKRRSNGKGGVKRNVHKFSMQLSINT